MPHRVPRLPGHSQNSGKVSAAACNAAMLALETNVLVRLLARDDARQALAADRSVVKGGWISLLVLAQASWVLDAV